MNWKKYISTFLLMANATSFLLAQFSLEDFKLSGTATKINEQCIRLVPDYQYVSGSAWYEKPIDLSVPFQMEVCLVFGEKDLDGADGIVFVFHPRVAITGWRGEGMGFSGLRPSLGIEFDTYQNYHLADPEEDHIAVMANGQTHHYGGLVTPVAVGNLEDNQRHVLRIVWDPDQNLLQVFLDNNLQVAFNGDIVNGIFGGNPIVYWGVTAATGRLSNVHEICIKELRFAEVDGKGNESDMLASVQFEPGMTRFKVSSHQQMEQLYQHLVDHPDRLLAIKGHTGQDEGNNASLQLSHARIRAVIDYLLLRGISENRILTKEQQRPYSLNFNTADALEAIVFLPK